MSDRDDARLPLAAEALLANWPAPPRDDSSWEALALRIEARVASGTIARTDDALLAPPSLEEDAPAPPAAVPAPSAEATHREEAGAARSVTPGEGRPRRNTPVRREGGPSLADIARAAVVRSSERDMQVARETLSHAARARATGEVASSVARAAETAAVDLARVRADRAARESQAELERPSAIPAPTRSGMRGALVGAGLTLLATAAAFALFFRSSPAPVTAVSHVFLVSSATATAAPTAEKMGGPTEVKPGASPALRAGEPPPSPAGKKPVAVAKKAGAPAPPPGAPSAPPEKSEWDQPAGTPAEGPPNGVPLQPPIGELTAALGRGVQAARPCLAGQTQPSWATIVFGSTGAVQSVAISGPTAGTPAESCIRNALMGMNVRPFAKPTFEARSVRLSP